MLGTRYIQFYITLCILFSVVLLKYMNVSQIPGIIVSISVYYLCGLYCSLVIHRLFLTPLKRFPGPLGAKISNIWFSTRLRKADAHRQLLSLHNQYGEFLRIGSSDLSISCPKAVEAIYGPKSKCLKGDWYDLTHPAISMQTTRIHEEHADRRRVWSAAFSESSLRAYESKIKVHQDLLIQQLAGFRWKPVNMSDWSAFYNFDVMGDIAFGKTFRTLESNENRWAIELLRDGMAPLAWMFPTWLFRMLVGIPGATRQWWQFMDFCSHQLDERIKVGKRRIILF